jgi:hypothetical protein
MNSKQRLAGRLKSDRESLARSAAQTSIEDSKTWKRVRERFSVLCAARCSTTRLIRCSLAYVGVVNAPAASCLGQGGISRTFDFAFELCLGVRSVVPSLRCPVKAYEARKPNAAIMRDR